MVFEGKVQGKGCGVSLGEQVTALKCWKRPRNRPERPPDSACQDIKQSRPTTVTNQSNPFFLHSCGRWGGEVKRGMGERCQKYELVQPKRSKNIRRSHHEQ